MGKWVSLIFEDMGFLGFGCVWLKGMDWTQLGGDAKSWWRLRVMDVVCEMGKFECNSREGCCSRQTRKQSLELWQ